MRDRVCAIRVGAFFDPSDPKIEYGGTAFDWTLVRDDHNPDKSFVAALPEGDGHRPQKRQFPHGREVPPARAHHAPADPGREAVSQPGEQGSRTRLLPAGCGWGPFVSRYTDHERAVIWLETVTPCMVRARYKKAGGTEKSRYASTLRVGGRHFAAVEIDGLAEDTFYYYTIELAPLPAQGAIPGSIRETFWTSSRS